MGVAVFLSDDRRRRIAGAVLACAMFPCVVFPCGAAAPNAQDQVAIQRQAERFLKAETADLPGEVTIEVKQPRAVLPACSGMEAFQIAGSRRLGRITVGVRCLAPVTWTVYLPAKVRVIGRYVVTRAPLPPNHTLTLSDLTVSEGDLGALPFDIVSDATAVLGYRTVSGLAAAAPLRQAVLRPPLAVQQGQVTRLTLTGPGFSIQSVGQALSDAGRGERVRVKTESGQVVSGLARDGQRVEMAY